MNLNIYGQFGGKIGKFSQNWREKRTLAAATDSLTWRAPDQEIGSTFLFKRVSIRQPATFHTTHDGTSTRLDYLRDVDPAVVFYPVNLGQIPLFYPKIGHKCLNV
jgi:hypothetical protein